MDPEGNVREDVTLPAWPDNYGRELRTDFETGKNLVVTLLSAMGHDQIMAHKEDVEAPPKKDA
jgi:translation initiation factor 5A